MPGERPSINDVLEHYDVRTKDRTSYMTNCPMHEDRTPSCSVNTERQLWSCKSCGLGGDSYNLIMEKEGLNFVRAREFAASLGLSTGDPGGSYGRVRRGADERRRFGGRSSAQRSRRQQGNSGYVPRWRRGE